MQVSTIIFQLCENFIQKPEDVMQVCTITFNFMKNSLKFIKLCTTS